jgi:hypothetical protein
VGSSTKHSENHSENNWAKRIVVPADHDCMTFLLRVKQEKGEVFPKICGSN